MFKSVLVFGVIALTAAGCGRESADDASTDAATGSSRPGSDLAAEAGSTEVEGAQPRLVVADAESGRIEVLDLASEDTVRSFQVENPSRLTTVNGRYVVATDAERAHLLDPGSWTIDHGDHSHSYVKDPVEIGALDGDEPDGVVAGDRKVAVFFVGTGTADVVDFDSLSAGEPTVEASLKSAPHQGVAVPISDHVVVSTGGTQETLPNALELRSGAGEFVSALEGSCPQMHGEAVFSSYFVVACDDGVLKVETVDGEFETTKFSYPATVTSVDRGWSLARGQRGPLVAAPTATGVLMLDTRSGEWVEANTADAALSTGVSSDGKTVFSVHTDGTFRVFDAVSGAELSSTPVLHRPYDASTPRPEIQVGGTRAYVSDPAGNTVTEIDYRDAGRVARTFELGFSPGSIGVVGA